jgi:hypothetical protein
MISAREILYGVYGAYRLCRFDPKGLVYLNDSVEGFWRSFFAALIIAPADLLVTLLGLRDSEIAASWPRVLLLELLAYVVVAFGYTLIVFYICRAIGRTERFILFIVAYNWAGVTQTALVLPTTALAASELLPADFASGIALGAALLILAMTWFIARVCLQIGGWMAAGLVALHLVLAISVFALAESRLGVG